MIFRVIFILMMFYASAHGWEYEIEVKKVHTYIEGRTGILMFNQKPVSSQIRTVQTPIGCFSFAASKYEWGTKGWIRCKEYVVQETDAVFNYLYAGSWYSGAHLAKTPEHWCWLVEYDVWIDPEKIPLYCSMVLKTPEKYANTITGIHDEIHGLSRNKLERTLDGDTLKKTGDWNYFMHYEIKDDDERTGRRGILVYKDQTAPALPGIIVCTAGTFKYTAGKYRTDDRGWFAAYYEPAYSSESITDVLLKKGFYRGARLLNTPESWAYLSSYDIWINPDMIGLNTESLDKLR